MSNPLFFRGKMSLELRRQIRKVLLAIRNRKTLFTCVLVVMMGLFVQLLNTEPAFNANAEVKEVSASKPLNSPLFENQDIFSGNVSEKELSLKELIDEKNGSLSDSTEVFKQKLYDIVGDAPIREMVPFISKRDEKVAAFLVGIAKKESSFGSRSPLKDGTTCYNYWGYKSSGGRGTSLGYACFASAEEAIQVVGDRIEVLVSKDRNTPARMVNTWKCGTSCAGDPGAPSWVATVKFYFDKIVG
ncbi:MAG: hypothetical protein ACD_9C00061G0002 [uncultured bacterium]|nr:MAG: hypothetical protein ACD_9C00061G0002 [uncultured bacterium]